MVLGHVQAMEARGVRLPDKLVRGFRAMLVVLRHHPPSVQTTLYYLRAVLNAAVGYQGMHLPYWREQLEEVEGEARRLIRGYEGVPTEVSWCVLRSPTAYYGEGMPTAGEAYRAHTARTLSRMGDNQEEVVRRVCYHAVAEVQKEENMCPRYVWHRRRRLAAGKKERMWRALQAVLPGEEHMLATNRTCGRRGPILVLDTDFGGAAHGTVRWIRKEGVNMEVLHVRKKEYEGIQEGGAAPCGVLSGHQGGGMGCIQVDDEESKRTRGPRKVEQEDARDVERVGGAVGDPAEEAKRRERRGGAARESGAGQGGEGQGQTGHTVVCAAGTQRTEGEGTECGRAVV